MADFFTWKVPGWKRHECVQCGTTFRTKFMRNVHSVVHPNSPHLKWGSTTGYADDDRVVTPCPVCGLIPLHIVIPRRRVRLLVVCAVASLVAVGFMARGGEVDRSPGGAAIGVFVTCALATVGYAACILFDPNRDRAANLDVAEDLMGDRQMLVLRIGSTSGRVVRGATTGHKVLLAASAAASLGALCPAVVLYSGGGLAAGLWWAGVLAAVGTMVFAGLRLSVLEQVLLHTTPEAVVESLGGKDGEGELLDDEPDDPTPPLDKPWKQS